MKHIITCIFISYITILNGCGVISKLKNNEEVFIFPGIDSLTAVTSDSISNQLFVCESRKFKANSLFNKAKKHYQIADSLWIISKEIKIDSTDSLHGNLSAKKHELSNIIIEKITKAENHFKKAIRLNPFDLNIKDIFASVYFLHGRISNDSNYFEKSIDLLKEINNKDKSNHFLYYRLGENYYYLKDWQNAYQNYHQAENALLNTAFLNSRKGKEFLAGRYVGPDSVDAATHFRYVYYQAITISKLYNTELALSLFQRAQQIAPSQDQLKMVENFTRWIKWDDGNIAASEKKNTYLQYLKEKKFKPAKSGFEKLIKELNTQKAIDEINWQVALIEYEFLDQQEKACQRLNEIVQNTPIDQETSLPIDQDYRQYFTDCGKMFFKLGIDYKKNSKYKDAYRCFDSASQIHWPGKWRSMLEIAKLLSQNPEKSLKIINQILDSQHNLNKAEQLDVLTLKLNALKRFGTTKLEESKDTYQQIRDLQKK